MFSVIANADDLTIALITRYLMLSTEAEAVRIHAALISKIYELEKSLPRRVLLRGIFKGSNQSFKTLCARLSSILTSCHGTEAFAVDAVLCELLIHAKWGDNPDTDFIRTVLHHSALATNIFNLLRRVGRQNTKWHDGDAIEGGLGAYAPALTFCSQCLMLAQKHCIGELPKVVEMWARADFFGALDLGLPKLITHPSTGGMTLSLINSLYSHMTLFYRVAYVISLFHLSARQSDLPFHHNGDRQVSIRPYRPSTPPSSSKDSPRVP